MMSEYPWLAGFATALSMMACYGALAAIAVMGAFGISIALNDAIWSSVIVALAWIAVGGLGIGASRHRRAGPIVIGGVGAAVLCYAFYVDYTHWTEFCGFALLAFATVRDWWLLRRCRRARQMLR